MAVTTTQTNKPFNPRGNDQSPKGYNRAALYSGKALDFDGVNDYVDLDGFTMSGNTGTFCFYADVDNDAYIFDVNPNRFIFLHNSAQGIRVFNTNGWSDYGLIDRETTLFYTIVCDGTSQSVYVNGQKFGDTKTITALDLSAATEFKLGSNYLGSGTFYNGTLSNYRIFNTALTAAQVADLYNNPEKVVPTGVDNTALKLWLPMQEGAGTTAINGAPDAIGSELVTNGTFDSADDWSHSSQYSISSGKASYNGSGSGKLYQTGKNLVGTKNYILTFDVSNASTYANIWIGNQAGLNSYTASATYQTYYNGKNAVLLEGANIGTETTLAFYANNIGSSFDIDNISLKEVANCGTISGATWTHGIGAPVAQTSVIDWNKWKLEGGSTTNEYLIPQGLTSGRDLLGNLFENVRKQGALNLDGNSWAEVHDNASLDITDAITLEAWVQIDDVDGNQHILGKWDYANSGREYLLYYNAASNAFSVFFGHGTSREGAEFPITATGQWFHLVGTTDGSTITPYVNGVAGTTEVQTTALAASNIPVTIGMENTHAVSNSSTKGPIAQPRIYNRALTAEEVQRNYNAGKNIYTN